MRVYAPLYNYKTKEWAVIYRDSHEEEWYYEVYDVEEYAAKRIANALNREDSQRNVT